MSEFLREIVRSNVFPPKPGYPGVCGHVDGAAHRYWKVAGYFPSADAMVEVQYAVEHLDGRMPLEAEMELLTGCYVMVAEGSMPLSRFLQIAVDGVDLTIAAVDHALSVPRGTA